MLIIRLQRTGTKNRPTFRLVLAESERSATKKFVEVLGHYNPRSKQFGVKSEDRLKYWVSQNVKLSPTVHNLLVDKKFVDKAKIKAWKPKKKELTEEEKAAQAAAAAPAAPAAEASSADAPAESAPVEAPTEAPATPEAAA